MTMKRSLRRRLPAFSLALVAASALPLAACEHARSADPSTPPSDQDVTLDLAEDSASRAAASMKAEEEAVLALVPDSQASAVAQRSGRWSDPSTWGRAVPAAGARVRIPPGIQVTYDAGPDSPALRWLRVDGTLTFERAAETRLTLDTLVVTESGTLEIGTRAAPITGRTELVFAGERPVATGADRKQFERGLVSLGTARLAGQTKTAFVKLAEAPRKGATTLALASAAEGWQPGDRVVLTGAQWTGRGARQDETRLITAVSGTRVTLDRALSYDHVLPAESGVSPYLANLTRNVRIASAKKDVLERGHVMFMHHDAVDVHAIEFDDLGRTNKETFADDPDPGPSGKRLEGDAYASPMTGTNVRGRYAVHLHRTGIDPKRPCIPITDSVVAGSPGWGFVNHGSHGCIRDNVAHDVLGAAFVSEVGTEIGDFTRNIAIGSQGSGPERADVGPHTDPELLDMWHAGVGFGMRSNAVKLQGNVASDQASEGFSWNGWDPESYTLPAGALPVRGIARSRPAIAFQEQPLLEFVDNVAIATRIGAQLDGMASASDRGVYDVISNFTAVNSGLRGIHLRYSSTIIRNTKLVNATRGDTVGINVGPTSQDDTRVEGELILNNVAISGFGLGVDNAEPMRTEGSPRPNEVRAFGVRLQNNGRDWATSDRLVQRKGAAPAIGAMFWGPGRLTIGNAGTGLEFDAVVQDGAGVQKKARLRYTPATINALIAKGYYGSDSDPYVLVELPTTDRLSGKTQTVQVRAFFQLALFEHGPLLRK